MNVVNIVPMRPSAPPAANPHVPVLLEETLAALAPRSGMTIVDATLGAGGHSEALLEAGARVIGFDRDEMALSLAKERLGRFGEAFVSVHAAFSTLREGLDGIGVRTVDAVLADIGVSSMQLDQASRGMSFRQEGPLDMRMDRSSGETALELIERLDDDELADIIYKYGEERRSRRVARCIKQAFAAGELHTTLDLRRAVVRAVGPARVGGVDPSTRTFQALRIAVNGELDELSALLASGPTVLSPGGVLAVITFHSLEDRLVKRAFADRETWSPLSKKPIPASEKEMLTNPRARSAKLRAARLVADESGFDEDEVLS
ncbi:MAG: 16S rRNA (cytosine(1402)-N(4))-methyltransferase RsmH [Polyangiaceae bacterium]|nr:16S rRNA (cytosine(1402)-N(4))-methyltransferase RsmH [Polyangiaceae bacterium]